MTGEQKAARKISKISNNELIRMWGQLDCNDIIQLANPEYDEWYDKKANITIRDWSHIVRGEMYSRRLILA